jgi:hypothetical protein
MRAFVAALLLLAWPAAGQPGPTGQEPAVPAEVFSPSAEAHAVFEALSTHVMTDEMLDTAIAATSANTRPMDEIVERSFARGEQVRDWQGQGIDVRAAVAARDGGLTGNMVTGPTQFGPAFVYYEDRPIDAFVSPEWVLVARRGAPFEGDIVQVEIGRLSPKVILAERIAYRQQGRAYCRVQAESRLYADPAVSPAEFDTIAVMMAMRSLRVLDQRSMCEVTEETGPGEYRTRIFDAEGYRLTAFDRAGTFRIVPRMADRSQPAPG